MCRHFIETDYDVVVLSRDPARAALLPKGVKVARWDGRSTGEWTKYVEGAGGIVNLAGENIAAGRWTESRKRKVLESRLRAGRAVTEAVRRADKKPKVVVQASAIGYYGDRGDEILSESSGPGEGYLAEVAVRWENATADVAAMGVRYVVIRTGVVLGLEGGFLPHFLLPFKFFSGGHQGSGKQWISWIHIRDEVGAIRFLLERVDLSGVFNLVAPSPVRSREFFKTLGEVMGRPSWLHIPGFVLRLAFGEMARELLLSGQRVMPERLLSAGYEFQFSRLRGALKDLFSEKGP